MGVVLRLQSIDQFWEKLRGHYKEIDPTTLKILLFIKFNTPSPSYSQLQAECKLSRSTVSKGIKKLTELGIISYSKGGCLDSPNQYVVGI